MASNLFKAAKAKAPVKAAGKQKTEVVIADKVFHTVLHRLATVNREMDALKSEAVVLSAEVKERGIESFAKMFKTNGKYPGSFLITATGNKSLKDANFMFIPVDKYITMDEERFDELKGVYGDVAEEKTVYELDSELVDKYGDIISELIEKCKKIPQDAKDRLIIPKTTYGVKKGTIEEALTIATKKKSTISIVLEDIRPIYQLKNVKIKE